MTVPLKLNNPELPFRLRHFTDRDEAIAAFDALWDNGGYPPFLAFYGLSGNGKSTLIDFLIETRCKPQRLTHALVDFEGQAGSTLRSDWRSLLSELAGQLSLHGHPAYLTAFEEAEARFQSIRQSLQVDIRQSSRKSGQISQSPITVNSGISEALTQADEQARYRATAGFLEALEQTCADHAVALFFDTCELLEDVSDKTFGGWLWQSLKTATDRLCNLRVIAAGRNALTGVPHRNREQEELAPFSLEDSDKLLTRLGVADPTWCAAVFNRLAYGHPLITEMAGNLWQEAQRSGLPIPIEEIPALSGKEQAVEWLTRRILDRLAQPLKDVVRWAALLRRFNQDILVHTLPETVGTIEDDAYERLRRYSFMRSARVGEGLACHDLMRQVQNSYLRTHKPAAFREFHIRAASYFAERNDLVEGLYHRLMAGDDQAPKDWFKMVHAAHLHRDWAEWAVLLDVAECPEQRPGPQHRAEVTLWRGMWHNQRYENEASLQNYEAAIALFRDIGDHFGEANTLMAIGDVQKFKKENEASLQSYEEALALFRDVGDRLGEARILQAIGYIQYFKGENEASLQSYEEALALFRDIGDRLGEANTLRAIGDVLRFKRKDEASLQSYEEALALFRDVGDRLGEANTLHCIGYAMQYFKGENEASLQSYEEALALFREIGDRLGEANTLLTIALLKLATGGGGTCLDVLDEALALYRKIGDWAGQANVYWVLGTLMVEMNSLKEAEWFIAQAVALGKQFGPPGHPVAVNMENELRRVRSMLNNSGYMIPNSNQKIHRINR